MKRLTVNQVMLLLDIYRGTDTQYKIGTNDIDISTLFHYGLIKDPTEFGLSISVVGQEMVNNIEAEVINTLKFYEKP